MYLEVSGERLFATVPSQVHPAGAGRLCLRGWQAGSLIQSGRRLLRPQVGGEDSSWEEALRAAGEGLRSVLAAGPQTVGVVCSGHLTNEEAFACRRFATEALRTPNLDNFAWAMDGGSIWGLEQTFCAPYRSPVLPEIVESDVILCLSSNLCWDNPQAAGYMMQAAQAGGAVIVLDEVDQGLRELATLYLEHQAGARGAVLHLLLKALSGGGELTAADREMLPRTGVDPDGFYRMCSLLQEAKRPALVFATTTVQIPSEAAHIAEIAVLLSASAAQEAAVFALRSQCNSVGVADMGVAPARGAGGERGLSVYEMLAADSPVRGLVVFGEALEKYIGERELEALRGRLDFLLYAGGWETATSQVGEVALPITSWGEVEGTFTCSDGSVWPLDRATTPAGESRDLPVILRDLSAALGGPPLESDLSALRAQISQQVFSYSRVDWGKVAAGHPTTTAPVLGEDAREVDIEPEELPVLVGASPERPYTLVVRRDRGSWAFDPRARGAEIVERELADYRSAFVVVNPEVSRRLKIREGRPVRISTAFGSEALPMRCEAGVPPEVVMLPWQCREQARALAGPPHLDAPSRGTYYLPVAAALENPAQS
jgi:predicted molibdopterin-dependent oxidoreductase YjgC